MKPSPRVAATNSAATRVDQPAPSVVVMGILVIAAIAFALEFIIRRVERVLVPWTGRE